MTSPSPPTTTSMAGPSAILVRAALQTLLKRTEEANVGAHSEVVMDHVDRLDSRIGALDVISEALLLEAAALKTTLARHRNSLLPIHTLPIEILVKILLFSLQHPGQWTLGRLQQLSQVCSLWWSIILSAPDFWTRIDSMVMLPTRLKRSKEALLNVIYSPVKVDDELIATLEQTTGRWRSLCRHSPNWERFHDVIPSKTPYLERLCIGSAGEDIGEWWSPDSLPYLRHLDLTRIDLHWNSTTFSKLKSLALRGSSRSGAWVLFAEDVLTALTSCDELEELCLESVELGGNTPSEIEALREVEVKVRFPRLRKLSLLSLTDELCEWTLRSVSGETLSELVYEGCHEGGAEDNSRVSLFFPQDIVPLVTRMLKRRPDYRIQVTLRPEFVEIACLHEGDIPVVLRMMCVNEHFQALGYIVSLLPFHAVPSALNVVSLNFPYNPYIMKRDFPTAALDVQYMQFSELRSGERKLFNFLKDDALEDQGPLPSIFPNLAHVHLGDVCVGDDNLLAVSAFRGVLMSRLLLREAAISKGLLSAIWPELVVTDTCGGRWVLIGDSSCSVEDAVARAPSHWKPSWPILQAPCFHGICIQRHSGRDWL